MIYLLRHGQTEFNRERRYQGRRDSPLTELGAEQAHAMGRRLKPLLGDVRRWALISSPLGRARQTAEIVRAEIGAASFTLEPRLAEIDMGAWSGLNDDDIEGQFPGLREGTTRYNWAFRAPGSETPDELFGRLRGWLEEVGARDVIAISHGIAGRGLCALYTDQTMETVRTGPTPQDSIFRLHDGKIDAID